MYSYSISRIKDRQAVDFDSLPVAKITCYPKELFGYKPYTQVTVCFNDGTLFIKLVSFEKYTGVYSSIGAVLFVFEEQEPEKCLKSFEIWAKPEKVDAAVRVCEESHPIEVVFKPIAGEDLQGIYWGMEVSADLSKLSHFGNVILNKASGINGNFFKVNVPTGYETKPHIGSFAPTKLDGKKLYVEETMCTLNIVDY